LFYLKKYVNKNIDKIIRRVIIIESIDIFIHILFIWKVYPEVFIWSGCVLVSILLFLNNKELLKYLYFSTILFISAPTISIIFGLSGFFISSVGNFEEYHFRLLYPNIIGATIILITIILSYKKYNLVQKISKWKNDSYPENKRRNLNYLQEINDETREVYLKRLFEKIRYNVEHEKKYLDPNFNLKKLSIQIGCNTTYVSKCINTFNKSNFNDFINKYRIDYFKKLTKDFDKEKHLIKDFYLNCGFKQQSTFNRVFKQFEGITPTEHIEKKYKTEID